MKSGETDSSKTHRQWQQNRKEQPGDWRSAPTGRDSDPDIGLGEDCQVIKALS